MQTRSVLYRNALWALVAALAIAATAESFLYPTRVKAALEPGGRATNSATPARGATPVLVELFTSEGCSSCPPADALLARLLHDQPVPAADIIVLEEHVDYWDGLGWHDRFSSHELTDRQSAYARRLRLDSDYTPQMIVDGTNEFVGNDSARALRAIAAAAETPKPALVMSPIQVDGRHLTSAVSLGSAAAAPAGDLFAAILESMASTSVLHGENGGRTLHHVSVVRSLEKVGTLKHLSTQPLPFAVELPASTPANGLRLVLFGQQADQGRITVALSVPVLATAAPGRSLESAR